jgi:cytochrome o ubiquinol oxidase subunit 3
MRAARAQDLFNLPLVALNTSMLLFSSITYGFAMIAMQSGKKNATLIWLAITGCSAWPSSASS